MSRIEKGWWGLVLLWLVVTLVWRPAPPVVYTTVPSVSRDHEGYRIFFELVKKNVKKATRTLRGPEGLDESADVLVVLNPSMEIDKQERRDLLSWVRAGGSLLVGHPVYNASGEPIVSLFDDEGASFIASADDDDELVEVAYTPVTEGAERVVPAFDARVRGVLEPAEETYIMGVDDRGRAVVTYDMLGEGVMIQLAAASFIDNASLGFKRTHLFAAALMDEIGRDASWVFDESNEGVDVQPSLAPLLGRGRFRGVFLHLVLVGLFFYWWRAARIGKPQNAPPPLEQRNAALLAQDIGSVYFRGRKPRWALERYVDYFERNLAAGQEASKDHDGKSLLNRGRKALEGNVGMDVMLGLVKEMARHQKFFMGQSQAQRTPAEGAQNAGQK